MVLEMGRRLGGRAGLRAILVLLALSVPPHVAGQDDVQSLVVCPMEVCALYLSVLLCLFAAPLVHERS